MLGVSQHVGSGTFKRLQRRAESAREPERFRCRSCRTMSCSGLICWQGSGRRSSSRGLKRRPHKDCMRTSELVVHCRAETTYMQPRVGVRGFRRSGGDALRPSATRSEQSGIRSDRSGFQPVPRMQGCDPESPRLTSTPGRQSAELNPVLVLG
jgi:hypothetical protein